MTATLTDPGSGHTVNAVAFDPAGTALAVGDGDGRAYLWNPATQEVTATLDDPAGNAFLDLFGLGFDSASLLKPGRDDPRHRHGQHRWKHDLCRNLATGKITATLTDPGFPADRASPALLAFSPAGTILATSNSTGGMYLWNPATRKISVSLSDPEQTRPMRWPSIQPGRSSPPVTAAATRTCGTRPQTRSPQERHQPRKATAVAAVAFNNPACRSLDWRTATSARTYGTHRLAR